MSHPWKEHSYWLYLYNSNIGTTFYQHLGISVTQRKSEVTTDYKHLPLTYSFTDWCVLVQDRRKRPLDPLMINYSEHLERKSKTNPLTWQLELELPLLYGCKMLFSFIQKQNNLPRHSSSRNLKGTTFTQSLIFTLMWILRALQTNPKDHTMFCQNHTTFERQSQWCDVANAGRDRMLKALLRKGRLISHWSCKLVSLLIIWHSIYRINQM